MRSSFRFIFAGWAMIGALGALGASVYHNNASTLPRKNNLWIKIGPAIGCISTSGKSAAFFHYSLLSIPAFCSYFAFGLSSLGQDITGHSKKKKKSSSSPKELELYSAKRGVEGSTTIHFPGIGIIHRRNCIIVKPALSYVIVRVLLEGFEGP
ncbi:hypothetical protein BJX61DRAFT_529591 [Aspergillus egyptiacus]|nr:hypothetical protein BJX61DRAFT_529591 [Aspergillus egyptiacus]